MSGKYPFLRSIQSMIDNLLSLYEPYNKYYLNNKNEESDFDKLTSFFRNEISNYKEPKSFMKTHGFNIGCITSTWSSHEGGYLKNYSNSYRLGLLYETVGHAMALPDIKIREDIFEMLLPYLFSDNLDYSLSLLLRTANKNLIKNCITRSVVKEISREKADVIFDNLFSVWNEKFKKGYDSLDIRLIAVVIPLLSRLSVKLSSDKIIKLFKIQKEIFISDSNEYNIQDVELIYECLRNEEMLNILPLAYETRKYLNRFNKVLYIPNWEFIRFKLS